MSRTAASEKIDRAVDMVRKGAGIQDAAKAVGAKAKSVHMRLTRAGQRTAPKRPGPERSSAVRIAVNLVRSGVTKREAAARTGATLNAVRLACRALGVQSRAEPTGRPKSPAVTKAVALVQAGHKMLAVAHECGCSETAIRARLKAMSNQAHYDAHEGRRLHG